MIIIPVRRYVNIFTGHYRHAMASEDRMKIATIDAFALPLHIFTNHLLILVWSFNRRLQIILAISFMKFLIFL